MNTTMIDTVILETQGFFITHKDKFTPNAELILNSKARFAKCYSNPSPDDKKRGIYRPRLTLMTRAGMPILKAEFSVPKLLYSNNVDEVDESQFETAITALQQNLKEMGARVWREQLAKARVTAFHPSKNIQLSQGYTASYILKELYKLDVPKYLDITKADFRNNGQALQFYSASNAFAIYDKIADLNKPASRAIDKSPTLQQLNLFHQLKQQQIPLEILRLEARLVGAKKINEMLVRLGCQPKPTFRDIFNQQLCKSIMQWYWQHHVQDRELCNIDLLATSQDQLANLVRRFPQIKLKQAIYLLGLVAVINDEEGVRGLRQVADHSFSNTAWQTLKKDAKAYLKDNLIPDTRGFELVAQSLADFHSYRLPPELQCKEK